MLCDGNVEKDEADSFRLRADGLGDEIVPGEEDTAAAAQAELDVEPAGPENRLPEKQIHRGRASADAEAARLCHD